jgi:hypothetical protein
VSTKTGWTAPGPGGTGLGFDYSALAGTGTKTYHWHNPANLPNADLFPGADLALTDGSADTIYYSGDAAGLTRVGEHQLLLGMYAVDAPYSDGPLELKFPLAYTNTWNDNISANFTVDGNPAVRTGTITGEADAIGWITLPGATDPIEVLRVRTHVVETITLAITTITHKRHVMAYYAMWSKYPVFRTYADSLSTPLGINQNTAGTEWLQQTSLGVASPEAATAALGLVPNPTDGPVDLTWTAEGNNATLEVFNTTGALVLRRDLGARTGAQRTRIDTDAWTPGLYLVRLRNASSAQVLRLTVR